MFIFNWLVSASPRDDCWFYVEVNRFGFGWWWWWMVDGTFFMFAAVCEGNLLIDSTLNPPLDLQTQKWRTNLLSQETFKQLKDGQQAGPGDTYISFAFSTPSENALIFGTVENGQSPHTDDRLTDFERLQCPFQRWFQSKLNQLGFGWVDFRRFSSIDFGSFISNWFRWSDSLGILWFRSDLHQFGFEWSGDPSSLFKFGRGSVLRWIGIESNGSALTRDFYTFFMAAVCASNVYGWIFVVDCTRHTFHALQMQKRRANLFIQTRKIALRTQIDWGGGQRYLHFFCNSHTKPVAPSVFVSYCRTCFGMIYPKCHDY